MENTSIALTNNTFNPWMGCTKVSPGCANCYAETMMDKIYQRVKWGKGQERQRTSIQKWKEPLKWQKQAVSSGQRIKVFCSSLADVFDSEVPQAWRDDLWQLIEECQNLDWQLLTKRPENVMSMIPANWVEALPSHIWLGTSVETQQYASRVDVLRSIPAKIRFLSCEPLLGPLQLDLSGIDWVIVGGESGHGHRPMQADWVRSIRSQCLEARAAFFFKQWGGKTSKANGKELDGREWCEFPSLEDQAA